MISISEIQTIIERILSREYNEDDIKNLRDTLLHNEELENLRDILLIRGNNNVLQTGARNINIGKVRDIKIGENIYQAPSIKAIQEAIHDSVVKGLSEGFKGLSANDFSGNYAIKDAIVYRHLTGINEYPTLSFLEDEFPEKLKTILGINTTPIIYSNNILAQLEKFAIESGNEYLISCIFEGASINYHINKDNYTRTGGYHINEIHTEEFIQSREDFEKDTLAYLREDKNFKFTPVTARFQSDLEEAQWTSILPDNYDVRSGIILQYPKMSSLKSIGKKDIWIKKIINQNPESKGFLLLKYSYIEYFNSPIASGCMFDFENFACCIPPTPYLRFIDVKNVQEKAIKIESINFNLLEQEEYKITNVDNRKELLKSGHRLTQNINIILNPQEHLLIPIEFGFDTKSHQKEFSLYPQQLSENLVNLINKILYVGKVPEEFSLFYDFIKALNNRNLDLQELYFYCPEQINSLITDIVKLSQEFLARSKSAKDLFLSVPKRFAIGSFMDVISLKIDGKDVEIDAPNDTPKFSMSVYFAYGSCPYLLVYNSKKGYWIELGTILRGKEHRFLQNTEIYNLGENISRIKIEERDREITYIKSLSIIYTISKIGLEQEAIPSLIDLATREKEYFLLHKGQSIEIDLEKLIPANALNIKMKINGYYKILN